MVFGINCNDFAYLPASNTRRGILIVARDANAFISDVLVGYYSLTIRVRPAEQQGDGDGSWWLSSVYRPHDDNGKVLFLEELEAIRDPCPGPWAICGDFNLILNEADKNNERINCTNLSRFQRKVTDLEL